jgi:hypothetical protein
MATPKRPRSGNDTGFADLSKADGTREPTGRGAWFWIAAAVVAVVVVLAVIVLR